MELIYYVFIIVFSLITSSFLNVVAIRIPKSESIVFPASHCVHCEHPLRPHDLIPIFSYLLLRGKCRYCSTKISPVYPLGEAATTCLFVFSFYQIGWNQELWIAIPLMALIATITISDFLYKIIPNKVNLFFFILFALIHLFYRPLPYTNYLIGVIAGGGLLLLIAIISRGGMGGGDIKLMAVVGMAVGWKLTLLAFFLASMIGGVIGGILLLARIVRRKEPIPFGPFLAVGVFIAYFWGDNLIHAYLNYVF